MNDLLINKKTQSCVETAIAIVCKNCKWQFFLVCIIAIDTLYLHSSYWRLLYLSLDYSNQNFLQILYLTTFLIYWCIEIDDPWIHNKNANFYMYHDRAISYGHLRMIFSVCTRVIDTFCMPFYIWSLSDSLLLSTMCVWSIGMYNFSM